MRMHAGCMCAFKPFFHYGAHSPLLLLAATATMDIDDLMKETFSAILVDAKLERSVVIQVIPFQSSLLLCAPWR